MVSYPCRAFGCHAAPRIKSLPHAQVLSAQQCPQVVSISRGTQRDAYALESAYLASVLVQRYFDSRCFLCHSASSEAGLWSGMFFPDEGEPSDYAITAWREPCPLRTICTDATPTSSTSFKLRRWLDYDVTRPLNLHVASGGVRGRIRLLQMALSNNTSQHVASARFLARVCSVAAGSAVSPQGVLPEIYARPCEAMMHFSLLTTPSKR